MEYLPMEDHLIQTKSLVDGGYLVSELVILAWLSEVISTNEREGFEVASTFRTEDNKLYVIFRRKPINNNGWTR